MKLRHIESHDGAVKRLVFEDESTADLTETQFGNFMALLALRPLCLDCQRRRDAHQALNPTKLVLWPGRCPLDPVVDYRELAAQC